MINAYMAEHWLYIPALGFFLVLGKAFSVTYQKIKFRKVVILLFAALLSFYSILTIKQNKVWNNSLALYEHTARQASHNWRAFDNLGYIYKEKGMMDEAVAAFLTAAKLMGNNDAAVYYNLANTLKEIGRPKEAIELYQQAIEKDTKFLDAYINLGNIYLETGQYMQAIAQYEKALVIDPELATIFFNLSNVYIAQGDLATAAQNLKEVIKLNPNYLDAYNNLANIYKINGKFEEAIALFEKVIKIDPDYAKAYYNLGDIYRYLGEDKKAIKNYIIATACNSKYAKAYYGLAIIYLKQGKYDLAIKHCNKARTLGLVDPNLLQALAVHQQEKK